MLTDQTSITPTKTNHTVARQAASTSKTMSTHAVPTARFSLPTFSTRSFSTNLPSTNRDNLSGFTWNRVMEEFSYKKRADGKSNISAVFANSVFPGIDPVSTAKLLQFFLLQSVDNATDLEVINILHQEIEESGKKEEMKGLLENLAASCLRFFDANPDSHLPSEVSALEFIKKTAERVGQHKKLKSIYGPVQGIADIRKRIAQKWNEKYADQKIDQNYIVLTNSFKQAQHYANSIGGKAFGLDNNLITTGFVACETIEQLNEIKRVFNLAMVSSSVINQLVLLYCLENDIELAGDQTSRNPNSKERIEFLRKQSVDALSEIYKENFDPKKVFFGNGAQNFVDKILAYLKKSGYETVLILAAPYHLYPASIKQNKMNVAMVPTPDDLKITPEFLKLTLQDQYEEWRTKNNDTNDACFKIAVLFNEPGNPSGNKNTSKEAKAIAEVMNDFAEKTGAELTYITDGAYKVLYGGKEKYIQDYLEKDKINFIAFESHSKSHWTFARLSFCVFYGDNINQDALEILRQNEPSNLSYFVLSLVAMQSRVRRGKFIPEYTQKVVGSMNKGLPDKFSHVKGGVYPFIFPKFPRTIEKIAQQSNPELRMKIIKTIFSVKFSNAQLAQLFNLEPYELELENNKLQPILDNFHNQKFYSKEIDIFINYLIEKENSFEDRVSVICDSIAPKSGEFGLSKEENKSIYETIFKLKKLGKLNTEKAQKALVDVKEMMESIGIRFGDAYGIESEEGRNHLLTKIEEELNKDNSPLGFINCRNTLFLSFSLIAYNGLSVANILIGNNGRIIPRPAFGGLTKEVVADRIKLLEDYLKYHAEAASDYSQPQPAEEREWVDVPAVGGELI